MSKKANLIIHIGAAKTGSTAIQRFLELNRIALAEKGVLVPNHELEFKAGRGDQIEFFETCDFEDFSFLQNMLILEDRFTREHGSSPNTILLSAEQINAMPVSAEHIDRYRHLKKQLTSLSKQYEIKFVLYVRRQADFLQAMWQQFDVRRDSHPIEDFVYERDHLNCDWFTLSNYWTFLGEERLEIRLFEDARRYQNGVVDDFLSVLNLSSSGLSFATAHENISFGHHVTIMLEYLQGSFESPVDHRIDNFLYSKDLWAARKRKKEWLFSIDHVNYLQEKFENSNEELRRSFLPQRPYPLFEEIDATDTFGIDPIEASKRNNALLLEALWKLSEQYRSELDTLSLRIQELERGDKKHSFISAARDLFKKLRR